MIFWLLSQSLGHKPRNTRDGLSRIPCELIAVENLPSGKKVEPIGR